MILIVLSLLLALLCYFIPPDYSPNANRMIPETGSKKPGLTTLLLVFAITLAPGKGFWQVFIAVSLTMWINVARVGKSTGTGL